MQPTYCEVPKMQPLYARCGEHTRLEITFTPNYSREPAMKKKRTKCRDHGCKLIDGYCPECKAVWRKIQQTMKNRREGTEKDEVKQ